MMAASVMTVFWLIFLFTLESPHYVFGTNNGTRVIIAAGFTLIFDLDFKDYRVERAWL